jgi:hypothetical protein
MAVTTTRKELEAVLERGEVVTFKGRHIFSKEELPTEAELKAAHETVAEGAGETRAAHSKLSAEHEALVAAAGQIVKADRERQQAAEAAAKKQS